MYKKFAQIVMECPLEERKEAVQRKCAPFTDMNHHMGRFIYCEDYDDDAKDDWIRRLVIAAMPIFLEQDVTTTVYLDPPKCMHFDADITASFAGLKVIEVNQNEYKVCVE